MQSQAKTVDGYLAELSEDRRAAISAVRDVILRNLDPEYEEGMQYGMIGYYVPHRLFPAGYHCDPTKPLGFASLASQKNHMALYMMCVYGDSEYARWFQEAWKKTGKKCDMGKSCIRFKKVEDLPLDVIGEAFRRVPARQYIEFYEATLEAFRNRPVKGPPGGRKTVANGKGPAKKSPAKAGTKKRTRPKKART